MTKRDDQNGLTASELGYQPDRTNVRAIVIFTAALGGGLILVFIVIWWLQMVFATPDEPPDAFVYETGAQLPPPPRLQESPAKDLEKLRQREHERLNEYAWVDREQGVVRIPIDRAMHLMLDGSRDVSGPRESVDLTERETPQP